MSADLSADRARIRSAIGPWGAWSFGFAYAPAAAMRAAAQAIEATGYGCLWYPETLDSHEAYTNAATLLAATERLHVATGIASIWSRDARASVQAARTLADASGDRFILGLGVSHRPLITARGHVYEKPVATMRGYLDAMDQAGDAVLHDLWSGSGAVAHNRCATCHRLDHHQTEGLRPGNRVEQHRRAAKLAEALLGADLAQEFDVVTEPRLDGLPEEVLLHWIAHLRGDAQSETATTGDLDRIMDSLFRGASPEEEGVAAIAGAEVEA